MTITLLKDQHVPNVSTSPELSNLVRNGTSLSLLWRYLASWISNDGGVYGPVVHRCDLKRMFSIHDTPWTQQGVIEGLLHLYRRSGKDYWLSQAVRLADAQCERQEASGRYRWAGHEDDRFSSLVHNALADCALIDVADVLKDSEDPDRANRYLSVARKNLNSYIIQQLYCPELEGFSMNPIDYYANRNRFIVNMNSVAIEAMAKLDMQLESTEYASLVYIVSQKIFSLQSQEGLCKGSLPYSHIQLNSHIPLYSALALRSLPALAEYQSSASLKALASGTLSFLDHMKDEKTELWFHKAQDELIFRYPIFVAGAGMICNGILDASRILDDDIDELSLANRLLLHQYSSGGIRNFIGYNHPDNRRWEGDGTECWEDIYPTPNWNAQAFHFLSRVLPPPEPPEPLAMPTVYKSSKRFFYFESGKVSCVAATWPTRRWSFALYVKYLRYGFYIPEAAKTWRVLRKNIRTFLATNRILASLSTIIRSLWN